MGERDGIPGRRVRDEERKKKGDTDNILVTGSRDLKGHMPARLDSAREWNHWICLSKDMPRYRFLIL
jgi:hypothetical protein